MPPTPAAVRMLIDCARRKWSEATIKTEVLTSEAVGPKGLCGLVVFLALTCSDVNGLILFAWALPSMLIVTPPRSSTPVKPLFVNWKPGYPGPC